MGQAFRDLQVWHRAMALAGEVYEVTRCFPREELFGLTGQIRRAAFSIPSNIAEGSGRNSVGEFKQFLGIARGSTYEIQTQLELSRNLKFAPPDKVDGAMSLAHEVGKMIYALQQSL